MDLPAKNYLLDSAHRLQSDSISADLAQQVMLLLLGKLFDHKSDCLEKIKDLVQSRISELPNDVVNLLSIS